MSGALLSSRQREILEALADHWVLQRWACRDGGQRWHLGEDEVDGRSVAGLQRRGLIAWDHGYDRLVLTAAGRRGTSQGDGVMWPPPITGWIVTLLVAWSFFGGLVSGTLADLIRDGMCR